MPRHSAFRLTRRPNHDPIFRAVGSRNSAHKSNGRRGSARNERIIRMTKSQLRWMLFRRLIHLQPFSFDFPFPVLVLVTLLFIVLYFHSPKKMAAERKRTRKRKLKFLMFLFLLTCSSFSFVCRRLTMMLSHYFVTSVLNDVVVTSSKPSLMTLGSDVIPMIDPFTPSKRRRRDTTPTENRVPIGWT